jgi:acyl transferase domain-containing protein
MRVGGGSKVPDPKSSASAAKATDPIAIIGIGCRYPGASNVEELWQNLLAGKDSMGHTPPALPWVDRAYESSRRSPGVFSPMRTDSYLTSMGFDSQFFELPPRESIYVDSQHRLLLEVASEGQKDAGQVRSKYEGSSGGGICRAMDE